jgi:hypothetical protein
MLVLVHYEAAMPDIVSSTTYRSELCQHSSVCQTENLVAKDGPNQPTYCHHAKRAQPHQHKWIQAAELGRECGVIAVGHHGGKAVVCDANSSDNRTALSDPSARSTECEEVVPCELRLRCRRDASCGLRGCRCRISDDDFTGRGALGGGGASWL